MARKKSYTDQQLIDAVKNSKSCREVARRIYREKRNGCSYLNKIIKKMKLDTSHFTKSTKKGITKYSGLIGKRNGMMIVKQIVFRETPYKKKEYQCVCQCDCGKEIKVRAAYFSQGRTYSCGCNMKIAFEKYKGENNKLYKGRSYITGQYWGRIFNRCACKGLKFNLDLDYALDLFEKQERKCALSNIDIFFGKEGKQTASLDRIDSSKGYVKGNVQWVHKTLNKIKSNLSEKEFIKICCQVADFKRPFLK